MKKYILSALFIGGLLSAQAQIVPAASPMAKIYQMVGLTEIEMEYSRPSLKDRKIFGGIVPEKEIWRTGANKATMISFSTDVNFGGKDLRAGSYSVFTIPMGDVITVILNNETELYGTGNYDEKKDAARLDVRLEDSRTPVETMRFSVEDITPETAYLVWAWGEKTFRVPMKIASRELAVERIKTEIDKIENSHGTYNQAAAYYLDNNMAREKALEWALKSVEINETFWNTYTLARAYHANGDTKNARKTAELSKRLSEEKDYKSYVERNDKLLKDINGK